MPLFGISIFNYHITEHFHCHYNHDVHHRLIFVHCPVHANFLEFTSQKLLVLRSLQWWRCRAKLASCDISKHQMTKHERHCLTSRLHLKKIFNFDVCVVWCSDGPINSQEYKSFEIHVVPIKISMTEYHHWINGQVHHVGKWDMVYPVTYLFSLLWST